MVSLLIYSADDFGLAKISRKGCAFFEPKTTEKAGERDEEQKADKPICDATLPAGGCGGVLKRVPRELENLRA